MSEIRIRGKKKRPEKADEINLPHPRGRPMKRASELMANQRRREADFRKVLQQEQTAGLLRVPSPVLAVSWLERLPVELIQQIFFHALELNLAHTSTRLLKSLSQDSIYRVLILFAFFEDDEVHPVETHHFLPAEYRLLGGLEKLRLQERILRCNWCDLRRIRGCMPTLTRLRMVQAWHEENALIQLHSKDESSQQEQGGELDLQLDDPAFQMLSRSKLPDLDDTAGLEFHFYAKQTECLSHTDQSNNAAYFPRLVLWNMTTGTNQVVHKTWGRSFSTLGARYIPDKLLCGTPWTVEKLVLLQLLRQGHGFIHLDFILNLSYEAMFQGMASAIKERNDSALTTLLELHYCVSRRERLTLGNPQIETRLYAMPFARAIPLELFHLASEQDEGSSNAVHLLLREGIDSIPQDDPVMTSWALRNASKMNTTPTWLLHHMEVKKDYGLGVRDSPLFINGGLNPRCDPTAFPFSHKSFCEELGYLTRGSIAFVPQNSQE